MSSTMPFQNKAGLSEDKLGILVRMFSGLKKFGPDVHDRALRYVLDDEDASVLNDVAGTENAAGALLLLCRQPYAGANPSPWTDFFRTIEPLGAPFYLRLAKVFEAAARTVPPVHFYCQEQFDHALWLEILLQECARAVGRISPTEHAPKALSADLIVEMLEADGRSPDAFVTSPFVAEEKHWGGSQLRDMVLSVSDLGSVFAKRRDLVAPFLCQGAPGQRLIAVQNLARTRAPVAPFAREIASCATETSRQLRDAAEAFLRSDPGAARPHLEQLAREGSRTQRECAIQVLGRTGRGAARPFLESLAVDEKSPAVRDVIAGVLNNLALEASPATEALLTPLPHEPLPLDVPVTDALRGVLERMIAECNEHVARHNAAYLAATQQSLPRYVYPARVLQPLPPSELEHLCRLLEHPGKLRGVFSTTWQESHYLWREPKGAFRDLLEHPDCQLIHVVRLLAKVGYIATPQGYSGGLAWVVARHLDLHHSTHLPPTTLRQVAEAIRSLELSDELLARSILQNVSAFDWEPEAIWPFFLDRLDVLRTAFEPPTTSDYMARHQRQTEFQGALRVLGKFPQLPPVLAGQIWDLAVGTNREIRLRAQPVAAKIPDLLDRLAKSLGSGNYQTRAATAEWMGRLGDARAVPLLDAAARKEKQDVALDEILTALERLGHPIEPYLDRDRLAKDAAKGLKKGVPEALNWFPWTNLPTVHWHDSGERVPREVVTWLLVQNFKLKSSEAGPLLRRYCGMIVPAEREALGEFVLNAWLTQDLKCNHTNAEARQLAQQWAPGRWQQHQQSLQWYQQKNQAPPAYLQQTQQQVEESIYQELLRECGSAVKEKGLLAVAGACCGPAAVAPVQKYLKEWYGYRAAQCKALIAMLSTIDHPSAIQYLLSISNRFRTKGIREEAEKYVRLLAERKGWTLDELADRTMPTAGLDDDGTLTLDFGPRQFTLRVNADLEPVLTDGDGKALKSLPAPRKDDDDELAKAAKKAFSTAKSELKKFAGMQRTRLYEAMCTQRTWPVADWRTYLAGHPLMRFLCQRLVWSSWTGGELRQTFRPLDDGTLTDSADAETTLADDATIRIAHECEVPAEVTAAWVRHLADYDVAPLFTQFGRGDWRLPDEKRRETALDNFQGHLVEAFKLRGLATKLGYTRGQTQDGGWFYDYTKAFPGLELEVQLGFSGNGLPEENRTVALTSLTFRRKSGEGESIWSSDGGLPLRDVPAILLSECYHDLRTIAATGSGFDPEWEKKVHG